MWLFIVFTCSLLNNHDCAVQKTEWATEEECGIKADRFVTSLEAIQPRANIIYYCQEGALAEEQTP